MKGEMLYKRPQRPGDGNIQSSLGQNGRSAAPLIVEDLFPCFAGAGGSGEKH